MANFKKVLGVVCFGVLSFGHVSQAIEHRIVPAAKGSKKDLEQRLNKLEYAVHELQTKVFNLQSESEQKKELDAADKKFVCEVTASGKHFAQFGKTKEDAKLKLVEECASHTGHMMYCENVVCKSNE